MISERAPVPVAALRARIGALEAGGVAGRRRVLPLGAAALDERLPGGGLALSGLHEIEGERAEWDDGVAAGFCLALLSRLAAARPGPLLWAAPRLDLYGPGLAAFGLDPGRLILVRSGGETELLWTLEEALRAGALAAVVGEVSTLERTAGRRLQLAAESAGCACLLLRRRRLAQRRPDGPSAAVTRWRVAPLASDGADAGAARGGLLGRPRWRVELLRCRGAAPASFLVEWDDAAGAFALAAALRDGSLVPAAPPPGAPLRRLAG